MVRRVQWGVWIFFSRGFLVILDDAALLLSFAHCLLKAETPLANKTAAVGDGWLATRAILHVALCLLIRKS
jgi:hypothetical protein